MTGSKLSGPMPRSKPLAVFLMGPTASGKTGLASKLLERLPCDIISVDSALVYQGMNIGTAKPSQQELLAAPHRLIDIRDPAIPYSVAEFRADALKEMRAISDAGRIPLLVGGTMMYFKALKDGMTELPSANQDVRVRLSSEASEKGWPHMHARLERIDPAAAARIHPNDSQRIQRALEIYEMVGISLSELQNKQQNQPQQDQNSLSLRVTEQSFQYNVLSVALMPRSRALLHQRIALRFEQMLEQGFVDEVRALFERGDLSPDLPAIRAVGYRQVWDYLEGKVDYEVMKDRGIIATRQLAKRQITWLRSWEDVHWFDTDQVNLVEEVLSLVPPGLVAS